MGGSEKHFGIVVGVDGSGGSNMAVRWAAHEAVMHETRLTLVHAIAMPNPLWAGSELRELYEADGQGILEDATVEVHDFTKGDGPREVYFPGNGARALLNPAPAA